ncbi:hypothetical protein [Nannocystis bainbridge]|uniref:EGF-like domain-containing protein n=1 Tax=Nannocystis bainbridge TaxID=2995303 RepID=A0ABT5DUV4_9BACT|nr:hypothetical protein [Nannocystis bainbridge]MDC0717428.1 hypothetical protein [Nannocystis bainbridge]
MRRSWLVWVVMLACEHKDGDPQGETQAAASTATDATGAPNPTEVSGSGVSTGGTTSEGEPTSTTSTASTTDTASTASTASTSGLEDDPEVLCQQFCDRLVACGLDGVFDGCPCQPDQVSGTQCVHHWGLTVECFATNTCESLESEASPCWKDFQNAVDWCRYGEDGCAIFQEFGGEEPSDGCVFVDECLEAPSRRLECDAVSCACEVDGAPAGTCAPEGVCDDFDLAPARFDACCGR